jgi:hypothetical protein
VNPGRREKQFYFEKQWLLEEDFLGIFSNHWQRTRDRFHSQRYSMDTWHGCLSLSRQYLRGWSANKASENRRSKENVLKELARLDERCDDQLVGLEHWTERYRLEGILEQIYCKEEAYWQQRSSDRWLVMGDANTAFFTLVPMEGGERSRFTC